jgi:hypothetical protein
MSKQLNVPELYLGLGGGAIAALLLYAIFGGAAIANLVGFLPPAYLSFRALSVSGQVLPLVPFSLGSWILIE